jgi:hypothetical protein
VFARSEAGIVGYNPTQGTNIWYVYVFILFVLSCVEVEALRRADHLSKEAYCLQNDHETEKSEARAQGVYRGGEKIECVIQWVWYNYCVEIRCQDTTNEDWEP